MDLRSTPVVNAPSGPTVTTRYDNVAIWKTTARLSQLTSVAAGTDLEVVGEQPGWFQVRLPGDSVGWVQKALHP